MEQFIYWYQLYFVSDTRKNVSVVNNPKEDGGQGLENKKKWFFISKIHEIVGILSGQRTLDYFWAIKYMMYFISYILYSD